MSSSLDLNFESQVFSRYFPFDLIFYPLKNNLFAPFFLLRRVLFPTQEKEKEQERRRKKRAILFCLFFIFHRVSLVLSAFVK